MVSSYSMGFAVYTQLSAVYIDFDLMLAYKMPVLNSVTSPELLVLCLVGRVLRLRLNFSDLNIS